VVGEVGKLSMTASRRLQLAAEKSGQMAIAIATMARVADAADLGQPTAAATRWRVSALPSAPLPVAGVGRPRWLSNFSAAAPATPSTSSWKPVTQRVISVFLPTLAHRSVGPSPARKTWARARRRAETPDRHGRARVGRRRRSPT
jgi:hypothetical protein